MMPGAELRSERGRGGKLGDGAFKIKCVRKEGERSELAN